MAAKYPLEALIKSRNWELDAIRSKVSELRDSATRIEAAVRKLQADIAGAEAELMEEGGRGKSILIDRRRRFVAYLKDRRKDLEAQRALLRTGQEALEEAIREMASLRRSIRALERHRERFMRNLVDSEERNSEKALDDMWLSRRTASGHD
jgi:peptidoglycan hydrolase CwlO-like protein